MRIAVVANGQELESIVPDRYEESSHMLIVETDDNSIVAVYEKEDADGLFFADKMNEYSCEAVACGIMQEPGFEKVASFSITRYNSVGCTVTDAVDGALNNTLPLITDFEGGSGCPSDNNDGTSCSHHEHHEHN